MDAWVSCKGWNRRQISALTLQILQDFMDYYVWVLCNYLISKRWDKFGGALQAQCIIVQGCGCCCWWWGQKCRDWLKKIKTIIEESRNNQTGRLREREAIRERAKKWKFWRCASCPFTSIKIETPRDREAKGQIKTYMLVLERDGQREREKNGRCGHSGSLFWEGMYKSHLWWHLKA